jgi:hypothetical protein
MNSRLEESGGRIDQEFPGRTRLREIHRVLLLLFLHGLVAGWTSLSGAEIMRCGTDGLIKDGTIGNRLVAL